MKWWTKVLAVALAAVVGLVPAFGQVSYAQTILPVGEELRDEDLLGTEGEVEKKLLVVGIALFVAYTVMCVEQYFLDEDYGIDWDDVATIACRLAAALSFMYVGYTLRGATVSYPVSLGGYDRFEGRIYWAH